MTMLVQPRHIRLYYAGTEKNWELAAAEMRDLRSSFDRLAQAIPNYQGNDVNASVRSLIAPQMKVVDGAIVAADPRKFAIAYGHLFVQRCDRTSNARAKENNSLRGCEARQAWRVVASSSGSLLVQMEYRKSQLQSFGGDVYLGAQASDIWTILGWNDIRQRYRRSVIGPFWITLSTAVLIVALGFIYSAIFKTDIQTYLPYLALGFIVWGFISATTIESCGAFLDSENIIKQVKIPISVFVFRVACGASHPIAASGSASVVGKYGLISSNGVPSTQSRNRTSN